MKILLVTQEPPLLSDEVVSGNAVRSVQLRIGLEAAGHQVGQVWLATGRSGSAEKSSSSFSNRDELHSILLKEKPAAVIAGYWELLNLFPHESTLPIILDYVAPRSLEELFEAPESVQASLRRLVINLRKCDLILVGNHLQRHLLINPLIEAGFDLRGNLPICVVPLGAEVTEAPVSHTEKDSWILVSGGVSWPWRSTGSYQAALEDFTRKQDPAVRLVHFGGSYRWQDPRKASTGPGEDADTGPVQFRALKPYRQFSEFLSRNAHIGVELAERNIEREYSQSFRSLEFLRHGMPLLCNRYLPISELVEQYDAGWIVDEPESLQPILGGIIARPGEWQEKSENALRLVGEALHPTRSVAELLGWLENPVKAARLAAAAGGREIEPVLGIPPLAQRIRRQFNLVRTVLLNRLFGQERGTGVLVVTRGDLFPPDHGAAVRTLESARALARSGVRVGIVTDNRKHWIEITSAGEKERRYPFWLRLLSLPGPLTKLLHFSKNLPYSNAFLYLPLTDGSFFWHTLVAGRALHAGVLQAEFPAYASPCIRARDTLNCKVVLVEHNVEYERIKAQVPELTVAQYQTLRAIEIDLCNRSDAVVCVSENDRQQLANDGVDPGLLHTVPHGVDLAQFDLPAVTDVRDKFAIPEQSPLLVYHGTFSYPPNLEALRIFAEVLLPGLEARGVPCHVLAVGRNPPAVSPHPRIHLVGSVEQVGPWLRAADLAVVPLVDGGGTRMKIIDCFAAGLPVISTSKGIEGIPVINGEHALVLDDWDAIITAVADLIAHPQKAKELAQRGRRLAESMDWRAVGGRYLSVYAALR